MDMSSDPPGWTPRVEKAGGPIYLAIADAISAAIAVGDLHPGEQLPTHRALANALSVDLTTITRAYVEARRRGLLEATVGRGTFVRTQTKAAPVRGERQRGPVDLGMNLPPLPSDPPLQDLLRQGLSRVLTGADPTELLTYRSGAGTADERASGADWLRPVLGEIGPERVLISPGAQPALLAVLGFLAGVGDTVLTDRLTYPGVRGAAAQLGIRLVGVASDQHGLVPDAVEEACRAVQPKALYCIPTINNPTAATMPVARRRALADLARRHGLRILEDDAYGLLPSDPIPAIATFAPEVTLYVSTVSKVISPALRLAYLVAPDAAQAARLATGLRANVLMASPLITALMASWVREGVAGAILSAVRRESAGRQKLARNILPPGSFEAHPEGLHLWLRLPQRWDRRDFVAHLRQRGLAVVPSDAFAVESSEPAPDAVRVSLGAAANREALREALRSVAATLCQEGALAPFSEVV